MNDLYEELRQATETFKSELKKVVQPPLIRAVHRLNDQIKKHEELYIAVGLLIVGLPLLLWNLLLVMWDIIQSLRGKR